MSSASDVDHYAVLGVPKDASLAEIKSAHRKLVLKCHPDKIKEESQRSQAQDEFQRVQQAYELLSDETKRSKYDYKVRMAELRRETMAREGSASSSSPYSSPRSSGASREYRDGRIYEERAPADAAFFDDEVLFTEEPRSMFSRKYDEYGVRQRTTKSTPDEKKKTKSVPVKEESTKATHSHRAKYRTKERRREADEKYEQAGPYPDSDDSASDSAVSDIFVKFKQTSRPRRSREPSSRKARSTEFDTRDDPSRYEIDEYSDELKSKHEKLHTTAWDYIRRSKGEIERPQRSSHSPVRHPDYESVDPETSSSRRAGRSSRSSRENVRASTSRNGSYEDLGPKVPSMPTAATSPGIRVSPRPPPQTSRSATTGYSSHSRSKRETFLSNMVGSAPRSRYDSGYSSPGTPEMAAGESPSKTRYKEPETILVEPSMPSQHHTFSNHSRAYSPPRHERPPPTRSASKPVRYTYTAEPASRYETRPPSSRQSSRPLFGEVYNARPKEKDVTYIDSRHYYRDYREPRRRQSASA